VSATVKLEGGCLVSHRDDLEITMTDGFGHTEIVGPDDGASALRQSWLELEPGPGPVLSAADSEVVLYAVAGSAGIEIGDRNFQLSGGDGVYIRAGEDFRLRNSGSHRLSLLATVCPQGNGLQPRQALSDHFDHSAPNRIASSAESERHATGDRFYKVLVGPKTDSLLVTQFIGMIPRSKAREHFHFYEEVICILSGEGWMWAGETRTAVRPGSLIFLPREQPHCLECCTDDGMLLVGVFFPAGSPAVNYETDR
jgi:mannose-6-phosphate isomerase-like protein (cupin superfamily)